MSTTKRALGLTCLLAVGILTTAGITARGQGTGVASKVGQKLDEMGRDFGRTVKMGWDTARSEVGKMGLHPRVYSRIHWDKALNASKIDVHIPRDGVVLLQGTVAGIDGKRRAVALASETVGVTEVVDELVVVPYETPAAAPAATAVPKAASSAPAVPRLR